MNIVVILRCFVASVMLSLLINVFISGTIVKHVVPIFVDVLYMSLL